MSGHPWCRDVSRDEAVRAAEDAAAVPAIQHRDLPDEVALLRASVADILGRVVRIEGEIDAGEDEARRQSAAWDGARQAYSDAIKRLTAERDAARADAEHDVREVLALARQERDAARAECERLRARVAELEAASAVPSWPRGWLTAEEREAVEQCRRHFVQQEIAFLERHDPGHRWLTVWRQAEVTLAALLARESPPRVKVPPRPVYHDSDYGDGQNKAWKECAAAYTAAIREAGGEVEG